jgi:hypothetical protein
LCVLCRICKILLTHVMYTLLPPSSS